MISLLFHVISPLAHQPWPGGMREAVEYVDDEDYENEHDDADGNYYGDEAGCE